MKPSEKNPNTETQALTLPRKPERTPSRQQVARTLDRMFRKNAEVLLQVFFDKLLEKIRDGDTMAMQQFERIYRLSQQSPAIAVQINNNTTVNNTVNARSRERRFESIIERLEKRDNIRMSDGVIHVRPETDSSD